MFSAPLLPCSSASPARHSLGPLPFGRLSAGLLGLSLSAAAAAQLDLAPAPSDRPTSPEGLHTPAGPAPEPAPPLAPWDVQVGLALIDGPSYAGAVDHQQQFKPIVSLRYGRFRLTTSRASLVEREADRSVVAGASLDLGQFHHWQLDAALRVDTGRDPADSPRLAGFEAVPTTLRGRLVASYPLAEHTRADLTLSTDLLGRGGGTTLGLDLQRRGRLAPAWRWTLGAGLEAADAVYQRSYHGVSAAAAQVSGLPRFEPGGGWQHLSANTGLTWQFLPQWRLGGAVAWQYLLGDAAASPLTEQRQGWTFTLGLVYHLRP
jgi:MipA family protein